MNASIVESRAEVLSGRRLRASLTVRNASGVPWREAEGFAFGYHIFDPETGTLVVDGPRTLVGRDVSPGEPASPTLDFDLPALSGSYRVIISAMRENVAWFYQRGWPFLLIDAVVEDGQVRIERSRVATGRTLARERWLRALGRAFTLPVATVWRHRGLIRSMVRRDVLSRYRGSIGGVLWTLLTPLLLMLTYFFVFGIVLESRFGADRSRTGFALYFLAGMLPWLAFSEAVGRAPTVLLEHRNFVKKLVFPVETLPVNLTLSGLVTQSVALALFLIALVALRGGVPASAAWLPLLIVPQVLLTLGLAWMLATLGVFVRDLGQLIGFLLTLWFFLTPICYPETSLPAAVAPLLARNPMAVLVKAYRAVLLEGHAPALGALAKLWILGAVACLAGYAFFHKLRRSFADVV